MKTPNPKSGLAFQAPHVSNYVDGPIRVRAKKRGFYGHSTREVGDVFGVASEKDIGSWMERVVDEQPELPAAEPESKPELKKADKPEKGEKGGKAKSSANDVL